MVKKRWSNIWCLLLSGLMVSSVIVFPSTIFQATEDGYTISYDANNGKGDVPVDENVYQTGDVVIVKERVNEKKSNDDKIEISKSSKTLKAKEEIKKLSRKGFTFVGWNTNNDGTGTTYLPGDKLIVEEKNITLFALWEELPPTFSVKYDINGGTGATPVDNQKYEKNAKVTVRSDKKILKENATFIEWNTEKDGSGTGFVAGDIMTMQAADIILYAQWKIEEPPVDETYSLIYHKNGGEGEVPIDNGEYKTGDKALVVDSNSLKKIGAKFIGWNTSKDGSGEMYQKGGIVIFDTFDITLYAQWETDEPVIEEYQLIYQANGGTGTVPVDKVKYKKGEEALVSSENNLVRKGYDFKEWNTKKDGTGDAYLMGGKVIFLDRDVTLYATWKKIEVPSIVFVNNTKKVDIINLDVGAPTIKNYLEGVTISDPMNSDAKVTDIIVKGTVDTKKAGIYRVTYNYSTKQRNAISAKEKVRVYIIGGKTPGKADKYAILGSNISIKQQKEALTNERLIELSNAKAIDLEEGHFVPITVKSPQINASLIGEYQITFEVKEAPTYKDTITLSIGKKLPNTGENIIEKIFVSLLLFGIGISFGIQYLKRKYN